jgi:hypothetical protein
MTRPIEHDIERITSDILCGLRLHIGAVRVQPSGDGWQRRHH